MIIDSHMHLGEMIGFNMPEDMVLKSIKKYKINYGVISNTQSAEFDHHCVIIPKEYTKTQVESNDRTLKFVKNNFDKFRGQFWIKPQTEGFSNEIRDYIIENRKYFVGIKMHPYHSIMKITDDKVRPYIEVAQELNMSFSSHTAGDIYSDSKLVYEVALKYPSVKFIMVHLGLGTDNLEAINIVSKLPNLYGDTTWVPKEKVLMAVKKCGADKILFGTDSPIDGVDTYKKYLDMLEYLKANLTKTEYEMVTYSNAEKIFEFDIK